MRVLQENLCRFMRIYKWHSLLQVMVKGLVRSRPIGDRHADRAALLGKESMRGGACKVVRGLG